jgi:hypothetical protein
MKIDYTGWYPVIHFDSKEEREEYDRQLEKAGFYIMDQGWTISLDEVRRRRFGIKKET